MDFGEVAARAWVLQMLDGATRHLPAIVSHTTQLSLLLCAHFQGDRLLQGTGFEPDPPRAQTGTS